MYKPKFNHVLVEINDKDAKWGAGDDGNIGGVVYREGKLLEVGHFIVTHDHPMDWETLVDIEADVQAMVGKPIMWNEGHEAGTVHEENGKKYALIFWWDIVACKGNV